MQNIRIQILEMHPSISRDDQNIMILGVSRRLAELSVKGLALNVNVLESVVRKAFQEKIDSPRLLSTALQAVFDLRKTQPAGYEQSEQLKKMLKAQNVAQGARENQGFYDSGQHISNDNIRRFAQHLSNELNNAPPLNSVVLEFLKALDKTKAVGTSIQEWTVGAWAEQFSAYKAQTPRGLDPVILGLTKLNQRNPSLALTAGAAPSQNPGAAMSIHGIANHPLIQELYYVESSEKGQVVRALMQGNYEDARHYVLREQKLSQAEIIVMAPNLDTRELDQAGFAP